MFSTSAVGDAEKPTLRDLLEKETLKNQWLNKFKNERRLGTVKSYLGDLRQFYFFLQCTSPKNIDVPKRVEFTGGTNDAMEQIFSQASERSFLGKRND